MLPTNRVVLDRKTLMPRTIHRADIAAIIAVVLYVGSFLVLSRIGIREAQKYDSHGYYFIEPTNTSRDHIHISLYVFFWPLVQIDRYINGGYGPATPPLREMN
jgi:hypothetical protein